MFKGGAHNSGTHALNTPRSTAIPAPRPLLHPASRNYDLTCFLTRDYFTPPPAIPPQTPIMLLAPRYSELMEVVARGEGVAVWWQGKKCCDRMCCCVMSHGVTPVLTGVNGGDPWEVRGRVYRLFVYLCACVAVRVCVCVCMYVCVCGVNVCMYVCVCGVGGGGAWVAGVATVPSLPPPPAGHPPLAAAAPPVQPPPV